MSAPLISGPICVLAREQDLVDALVGDGREGDRQARDGDPEHRERQVRPWDNERQGSPGDAEDHEGDHGDRGGQRNRPEEIDEVRACEVGQRQRLERDGAGVDASPGAHADRDQGPDPGREQPRDQYQRQPRPAQSRRFDQDHGRDQGRAEEERDCGERPGDRDQRPQLRWGIRSQQPDGEEAETPAQGDQGRLGPDHRTEADRRQAGEQDAGQLDRLGGLGGEALARLMPSLTRQPRDREGDHETGKREHGKGPPPGCSVVPQGLRKVRVHPHLGLVNQLQEAPRDQRGDDAHDRGEHEQHPELAAAHDRAGVGWRSGGLSHRAPA